MRRPYPRTYKPITRDSDRAIANATLYLTGARTLDGMTADKLAHQFILSPKRAEYMLTLELQRRDSNEVTLTGPRGPAATKEDINNGN